MRCSIRNCCHSSYCIWFRNTIFRLTVMTVYWTGVTGWRPWGPSANSFGYTGTLFFTNVLHECECINFYQNVNGVFTWGPFDKELSLVQILTWRGTGVELSTFTSGTLMTSAAADVINHNGRKIGRFKPIRFFYARMTSAQSWSRCHHWFGPTSSLPIF